MARSIADLTTRFARSVDSALAGGRRSGGERESMPVTQAASESMTTEKRLPSFATDASMVPMAEVEAELAEIVLLLALPVASGLAITYFIISALHFAFQPRAVGVPVGTVSAINGLLIVGVRVALSRRAIPGRFAAPLVFGLTSALLFQALFHSYVGREPISNAVVPVVIVGASAILVWPRWLAAFDVLALGSTVAMKFLAGNPDRLHGLPVFVAVTVLSGAVLHRLVAGATRGFLTARGLERLHRLRLDETVTTLWQTEGRLQQTLAELKRSNGELEQLAHLASHDLKEPLRMVSSYMTLLRDRHSAGLGQDAKDYIDYAIDGAQRMRALIDALLAFARVGATQIDRSRVALDDVLDAVVRDLGVAIGESGALVTRDPMPTVEADATKLRQLFQNLVANALRFRGQAAPRIHLGASPSEPDGEPVFSVSDNGIGIAPEQQRRLFTLFVRLNPHDKYPGTGLGLAVCHRIVGQHGGRIWIESAAGKGSTFRFTLPAAPDGDAARALGR